VTVLYVDRIVSSMKDLLVFVEFFVKRDVFLSRLLKLLLLYEVECFETGQLGRQSPNLVNQITDRLHEASTLL